MRALVPLLVFCLAAACGGAPASRPHAPAARAELRWSQWDAEAFARARREGRPIMVSVQAGWCHWCHVMNDTTLSEPDIVARLQRDFVLIRADGDARPDLAERYRRYAWPATVFLAPDGAHILGVRGYLSPARFRTTLDQVAAAHAAGTSIEEQPSAHSAATQELGQAAEALRDDVDGFYDEAGGGWGTQQRYPIAALVEHSFLRAHVRGEASWRQRALFTLDRYALLLDPEFGGMYQYSVPRVWTLPHFEKIVPVQAGALRNFAQAYLVTRDPAQLERAQSIRRYVLEFLRSPEGVFYASQDADLGGHGQPGPALDGAQYFGLDAAARRALGVPRVDTHVYAAYNGMLIEALAQLAIASADDAPMREGARAMDQLTRTHLDAATGLMVREAQSTDLMRYLSDQAYVLAALLALHQATGEARWLVQARALADASAAHLCEPSGAFLANTPDPALAALAPAIPLAENGVMARALMRLGLLTDEARYQELALRALRGSADRAAITRIGRMAGEYLMALELAQLGYVRLSIVGPPSDGRTEILRRAALALDDPRRVVDVHAPGEGPYPYPGEPSVFVCTHDACSMPITDPDELSSSVSLFLSPS